MGDWCLKCTGSLWSVNCNMEIACPKAVLQSWSLRIWITFANSLIVPSFSLLSFLPVCLGIVAVLFKTDYSISSAKHLWASDRSPLPGSENCSSECPVGSGRNGMQHSHVMVMTREQSLDTGDVVWHWDKMTSRGPF